LNWFTKAACTFYGQQKTTRKRVVLQNAD